MWRLSDLISHFSLRRDFSRCARIQALDIQLSSKQRHVVSTTIVPLPKFIVIVVTKRHHIRCFLDNLLTHKILATEPSYIRPSSSRAVQGRASNPFAPLTSAYLTPITATTNRYQMSFLFSEGHACAPKRHHIRFSTPYRDSTYEDKKECA